MQLGLFRALFPRWNFFDRLTRPLALEFKAVDTHSWNQVEFEAARTRFSLLVNPAVTLLHAEKDVLDDFVTDLSQLIGLDGLVDLSDVRRLSSFRMIEALVFARLKKFETNATQFQFRISAQSESSPETIFVSDVLVAP